MTERTPGLPMFISGIRQKVHDLPVLSICDATDETQILIPYGDGSDKQHAEAYGVAHLVLKAVNNHDKLVEALNDIHQRAYYEDEPSRNMKRIEMIAGELLKTLTD